LQPFGYLFQAELQIDQQQYGILKTRGFAPPPPDGFGPREISYAFHPSTIIVTYGAGKAGFSEMLNSLPTVHPTSCQGPSEPILRFFFTGVTFGEMVDSNSKCTIKFIGDMTGNLVM